MGGSSARRKRPGRPQVLFILLLPLFCPALGQPVRYSIPEELDRGSVVGKLAKDLGLSVLEVSARKLRVSAEKLHFSVDSESGDLHLMLTAVDGGDPPRTGTTQLRIRVVDANDNRPVFSQDVYRVRLPEDLPPGTTVLRLKAMDQDEGINAEFTYSFLGVANKAQFSLDPITGDIVTRQSLDFEEVEQYTIDVEAKDRGSLSSQCKVIIEVLDENDNRPEIIITSLSDQISEDSPSGTVVALFKVRDRDSEDFVWTMLASHSQTPRLYS